MKKLFLPLMVIFLFAFSAGAQIGINTTATPPAAGAMLDISGTNKGLLIPRLALTGTDDVTTIPTPVVSLMVYNTATTAGITAVTPGYYYRTATAWQKMMNVPNGTATGQMLYWTGTQWLTIAPGIAGQYLQFGQNNLPGWAGVLFAPLTTMAISGTSYFATASSGGNITSDGGSPVTARGVCWSTTANPTIAGGKTVDGTGTGSYGSTLNGLLPATLYYVRAYSTNTAGTAYGNEISFTTVPHTLAVVSTTAITGVTGGTANSGVNVTAENGSPVTAKGVCWSTSPNPTVANSKTTDGTGTGSLPSFINGLTTTTAYYVRAYATNGLGTAYGTQLSFTTTATLTIGGGYQGGIIAYFFQAGDPGYLAGQTHGLIAPPTDQSAAVQWSANAISNATATALGQGNNNTTEMYFQGNSSTLAGGICYDLVYGGYSDWFLPSRDELNKLYLNRNAIGGFTVNTTYWSSSAYSNTTIWGWGQQFPSGFQDNTPQQYCAVRAVRQF
ncbi:MAG: DUF1566 domain-containing protein [Chitinophagaceae bacterium]